MLERFDIEKKEIGVGKQATVYYFDGFAYKTYKLTYPIEWVEYELQVQKKISETPLPTVKYFKTEDPHIIKMEYINGVTLADRIIKQKHKRGVEDLLKLQKEVHLIKNLDLPKIVESFSNELANLDFNVDNDNKALAVRFLSEIEDKNSLCHLDFHFLNIMFSNNSYYIIDWINARIGNPIFDFARTYVILYEVAYRLSQKYLTTIKKDKSIKAGDINKAIYIMAILRTKESPSPKLQELIVQTHELLV